MKPSKYLFILPLLMQPIFSEDWPGFGGVNGNFISSENKLKKTWGNQEPEKLWDHEIGLGFSSIIESNGLAYTQGYSNGKNNLYCVDVKSGEILWKSSFPCTKADNYFKGGSRSTPLWNDGNLYLSTHMGDVYCLNSQKGNIIWSLNMSKDLGGKRPTWGYAASPVIIDQQLILVTGSPNGSLVALNKKTGEVLWKNGNYGAAYATPQRYNTTNQLLVFHEAGLSLHNLSDGSEISFYQHKTRYGINASQPLAIGSSILLSSAYGKGSAMINLSSKNTKVEWKTEKVAAQMASLIQHNGYVYGIHGQAGTRAKFSTLFCMNSKSGKIIWEKKGYGLGSLILVGDSLILLNESGEIVLIDANPKQFIERASFQILSGKDNWVPPSYANGRLHCRSSDGTWVCLKMGSTM